MIAVWPLSGFSKKCVDEKTSVERSQSRTGNSIVLGILQVSVKLDKKCSRGISYSSQTVFFQSLHYTCFSSAVCPLQVPALNDLMSARGAL